MRVRPASEPGIERLQSLRDAIADLEAAYARAVAEVFPKGCVVHFAHGQHLRHVRVIGHAGSRVWVQASEVDPAYWIDAARILGR